MNTLPQPTKPERNLRRKVAGAALALASVVGVGYVTEAAIDGLSNKAPKPVENPNYLGSPALRAEIGNSNGALTPKGDERGTPATTTTVEVATSAVAPSSTEITLPAVVTESSEQAPTSHEANQQATVDVASSVEPALVDVVNPGYAIAPEVTVVASEATAEPEEQATGMPPVPETTILGEPTAEVSQIDPPVPALAPEVAQSAAPAPPTSQI